MAHLTRHQRLNLARGLEADRLRSPVALELLDSMVARRWYLFAWPIMGMDERAEAVQMARQMGISRPSVVPFLLKRLAAAGYLTEAREYDDDGDSLDYLTLSPKALAVAAGEIEVPRRKGPILPRAVERRQIAEAEEKMERLWRAWYGYLAPEPVLVSPPAPPPAPPAPTPRQDWPPTEDFSSLPPY